MKILLFTLICALCHACSNNTAHVKLSNIIDLTHSIQNKQEVKLSSIADSITFIPLETKEGALIANKPFTFYKEYIFNGNMYFDWSGKFLGEIGRDGRGPGEDMYMELIYLNTHFYSKGGKFIEYDNLGKYTGKEISFYTGGLSDYAVGKLTNVIEFTHTQKNIILYNYPDSVFFMDTNFNILGGKRVLDYSPKHWINSTDTPLTKYTSSYNGTVLFYNFFNDTIYRVADNFLTPKWIVHIDKAIKTPNDFLYRYEKLLSAAAKAWQKGNVANSELIEITDNTNMVLNTHETNHYLFFTLRELRLYTQFRDIKKTHPYMAYYNKSTGEIIATQEQGFIDDITELGYFLPKYGIYDNKMISSILPHQLQSYIETAKEEKKQINYKLINLSKKVNSNDNPILILVHLKR